MIQLSIGEYRVNDGETLPTANLNDEYEIAWDRDPEKLYTVIVLDEGSVKKASPENSSVHLFWTNIADWEEVYVVADYIPPQPEFVPHKYSVYIFQQNCHLFPNLQSRENFNLREVLNVETRRGCDLELIDYLKFYGVADPLDILDSEESSEGDVQVKINDKIEDEEAEKVEDVFGEWYNTEEWNEEDYRILAASVYGISNPEKLTIPQIIDKINKILLYRGLS